MIKILVVDDSVVFRKIITDALSRTAGIQVVGTAVNGEEGIEKIKRLRPDLITLDVEMPKMDGLQTLDEIKKQHLSVGVIMFSSLTSQGAKTTLEALSKGAFDFVAKPTGTGAFSQSVKKIEQELIPKIKAFATTRRRSALASSRIRRTRPVPNHTRPPVGRSNIRQNCSSTQCRGGYAHKTSATTSASNAASRLRTLTLRPEVVAIGVSTGGPNALGEVIPKLPAGFRLPVLLVQHMPPVFTAQLAKRLNDKSPLEVVEAKEGDIIHAGKVYIAPGNYHMEVGISGTDKIITLNQSPPVNSCRPAVDVMFKSVAKIYGGKVIAVIMTGMGQDGFEGCKLLKQRGASIIAQDEDSCVVWGMPKFVTEAGLADRVEPLNKIAITIQELCGFMHK